MNRVSMLALIGLLGGAMTFGVLEWSRPDPRDIVAWSAWEGRLGLLLGLLLGLGFGTISGYWRRSRHALIRGIVLGAVIGAVGGAFGIRLGSVVYSSFGFVTATPLIGVFARAIAWSVFGAIVGATQGAAGLSVRRCLYGAIGGALGGFAGGIAFDVIGLVFGAAQSSVEGGAQEVGTLPRAFGFSILGLCIGLFIGIIEAVSRKAWVKWMVGRNEGREFEVEGKQTFIGSAEGAQIFMRGDPAIEPFHACIRKESGGFVVHALPTQVGIGVNGIQVQSHLLRPGDVINVGQQRLVFMLKGSKVPMPAAPIQPAAVSQPVQPVQPVTPVPLSVTQVAAVQAPLGFVLVALQGPMTGQRISVANAFEIGREVTPALAQDSQLSRRHAKIEPKSDGVWIEDMGSTNGVVINGMKVPSVLAKAGETVQLGSSLFRIERG